MPKILMIQPQAAPYPGTAYLCGAARSAGHEFVLHLGSEEEKALKEVERERPDLVGFSCMTGLHSEALRLAISIKKHHPKLPIILGGPHPTFFPEIVEHPAVDAICRGEGEYALIELLNAMRQGWEKGLPEIRGIRNLYVKADGVVTKNGQRPLADPMDELPMIDWSCYRGTDAVNSAPVAFPVRGCPYSCSYCFNDSYKELYKGLGRPVRMFGVERALREVEAALGVFAKSPVLFQNDTFGTDPKWLDEFLSGYEKLTELPFVALVRPELATDEIIGILAKHRCMSVAIGVESGSERVRKDILKRRYTNDKLIEVAEALHRAGIKFRTYNMIGIPTETLDEIWETIELNVKMKADYPRGAIFTPMPGTELTRLAMEMGYLGVEFDFDDIPKTILAESILEKIDRGRIKNLLCFFQTAVKFPWSRPLIRQLVKIRPNILFRIWFLACYANLHRKFEGRSIVSYVRYVLANRAYK